MSREGEDGFLGRWARRKAEARQPEPALPAAPQADAAVAPEDPAFDVSALPPVETLTADTDFTAFMQKGVPAALRNAALQKLWVTDPAIRDYIGLSEMSWDFNAPEAFHGYGALAPGTDVAAMVRQIAGDLIAPKETGEAPAGAEAPTPALVDAPAEVPTSVAAAESERDAMAQDSSAETAPDVLGPARRRHGGATPR